MFVTISLLLAAACLLPHPATSRASPECGNPPRTSASLGPNTGSSAQPN